MNIAQKRAWLELFTSLIGILIGTGAYTFIAVMKLNVMDISNLPILIPMYTLVIAPLILMVVISAIYKTKQYDERDKQISSKSQSIGAISIFAFLTVAALYLHISTGVGNISTMVLLRLLYLACFVWTLTLSVTTLVQYGRGEKNYE